MFDRRGKRKGERRRKALLARPFVAGVLTLFVIFQGLTAIGFSVARFSRGGGETNFVVSLLGVTCAVDAHPANNSGDHHSPAHEHGSTQCCVLCGARDLDGVALPAVTQERETIAPLPALVAVEGRSAEAPMEPPIGWASSWSSQAPPVFS
jgi:hypothetical protein